LFKEFANPLESSVLIGDYVTLTQILSRWNTND